ncbi:MAG: hybrid sensor histidine kinase/response regulator [Spirulina sp. SIO3F2]|nr:hybrid sensor histidine kinase/response regulator [Spirulina sp. SIO3F2]
MESSSSSSSKADILVVDDIPDNIRFLASMLKERGFHVRPAINGQIALRAAQTAAPDLILLDINMPNMDGYTVCNRLKENPQTREIPVIFLSALSDAKDKVKAFEVGAADYISKPFFMEEVLARISHQLKLTELQRKLAQRNGQLNETLNQLQQAQSQLVQSEKMTAVNQLVAGLAHELNNPITFIHGNLSYAQGYVKEILELVLLYQREYPQPSPAIQSMIADLDLDFVYKDLQHVLQSMQTGTERIRQIITGLKDFSRFDEQGRKSTNIHQAIESTLNILEHRLNPEQGKAIAIKQQYTEIPQIVCSPGQLNQVFYHILANSIDAIESTAAQAIPDYQPQIQICTVLEDQWLTIQFIDNGIGIEPEHQPRLFEPFFTAKPIGQGTGLGLAIAYQIVVKEHQGQLSCTSEVGQGTTMTVQLPLDLPLFST